MKQIAVFPGSFDPFTRGHKNIVERALPLFDEVVIAIGTNSEKKTLFSLEKRMGWIGELFGGEPRISVTSYEGLTIDFCKRYGAAFIVRGVRNTVDFEYEKAIAQMNKELSGGIETLVLFADPEHSSVSSSAIRDIIKNKHDYSRYVPFSVDDKAQN